MFGRKWVGVDFERTKLNSRGCRDTVCRSKLGEEESKDVSLYYFSTSLYLAITSLYLVINFLQHVAF